MVPEVLSGFFGVQERMKEMSWKDTYHYCSNFSKDSLQNDVMEFTRAIASFHDQKFTENDVLSVMEMTGCDRETAVQMLKQTNGDLQKVMDFFFS